MYFSSGTNVSPADRLRCGIPRFGRRMRRRPRNVDATEVSMGLTAPFQPLHRRFHVLESLAMSSAATRTGSKAPQANRARSVARGDHCAAAASLRSGSHAQRRMPGGRERPWSRERSVSLLEQIGRHSNAPLSEPGRAGSALDAAVLEGGRHLPEGLRCHLGLVRRAQVMTPARR